MQLTILEAKKLTKEMLGKATPEPQIIEELYTRGVRSVDGRALKISTVEHLVRGVRSGKLPLDTPTTTWVGGNEGRPKKTVAPGKSDLATLFTKLELVLGFDSLTPEQKIAEIRKIARQANG